MPMLPLSMLNAKPDGLINHRQSDLNELSFRRRPYWNNSQSYLYQITQYVLYLHSL
ncbi:hypothetical protein M378DRAFT_164686 [Amanita muscaria Koide BX008]|uniref:Uncharacterized protein n=1 Tax=Amanita muscaria (strain Koide BX008) TaxID=946122 RepID=A0A0C2WP19_AMAMK|nr:hypothetical protein M378DRAFT_164686 [Amanita muscaria Koide BX008]